MIQVRQSWFDYVFQSYQQKLKIMMFFQRIIAAGTISPGPWSPPMVSSARRNAISAQRQAQTVRPRLHYRTILATENLTLNILYMYFLHIIPVATLNCYSFNTVHVEQGLTGRFIHFLLRNSAPLAPGNSHQG